MDEFVGNKFLKAMAATSALGKSLASDLGPLHTQYPRLNITNPGGLRILILMSCGPCMTNANHMKVCQNEVAK